MESAISQRSPGMDHISEAKRMRIASEFDNLDKKSFVHSMVVTVGATLAADAECGNNKSNQIRRRMKLIAKTMDGKNFGEHNSAGRAVLESRFALGYDDAQYMSQAVSLLWAGDGRGESIPLVPATEIPEILRAASSRGLIRGMQKVLDEKRSGAMASILKCLDLVSWLLQIDEVRSAVVDCMEQSQIQEVKAASRTLGAAYNDNNRHGSEHIRNLLTANNDESNRDVVRELLQAVYLLVAPTFSPSQVVGKLTDAMSKVVRHTESSSSVVRDFASVMTAAPTIDDLQENANYGGMCPEYKYNKFGECVPVAHMGTRPNMRQFSASVNEAKARMENKEFSVQKRDRVPVQASNVRTMGDAPAEEDARWFLARKVSTFCHIELPNGEVDASGVNEYDFDTVIQRHIHGTRNETCAAEPRYTRHPNSVEFEHSLVHPGMECIAFCLIRGVCGLRGPHQQYIKDDPLDYNYPSERMKSYTQGSFYNDHKWVKAKDDVIRSALEKQDRMYISPNGLEIDTDFVGKVIAHFQKKSVEMTSTYIETAMPVQWAPIHHNNGDDGEDRVTITQDSLAVCEAATYEMMSKSLLLSSDVDEAGGRLRKAAAAAAKIFQLSPLTRVRSNVQASLTAAPTAEHMRPSEQYVTRPCIPCRGQHDVYEQERLLLPADAGLALFRRTSADDVEPLCITNTTPSSSSSDYGTSIPRRYFYAHADATQVMNDKLTSWLRTGIQTGIRGAQDTDIKNFNLMLARSAESEPVNTTEFVSGASVQIERSWLKHIDVEAESIGSVVAEGLNAIDTMHQLDCEDAYIKKLSTMRSEEQQGIFGRHRTVDEASNDRRSNIWSDALREVAISGDRLYRFVVTLTGAIGEAADTAIAWEDQELKQLAKQASERQKALAERVSQFQTKLVESVVTSTLRTSKLQLDVRSGNAGDELVVLSSDVKENIRQITSGEAGHGFFESSVELNHLMGTSAKPLKINDLVRKLQAVGSEFQQQVQDSLAPSVPASYSRISEPRNSYMLHLKPDTSAAIQKAFDHITSELKSCEGYHRHIHLWEFVEGNDWVLTTRFAELVGNILQYTRMRSGSFAAYVGSSQLVANGHNIRMQIQRVRSQACEYLDKHPRPPDFLQTFGRTLYFGGAIPRSKHESEGANGRGARFNTGDNLEGNDGSDDGNDDGNYDGNNDTNIYHRLDSTDNLRQSEAVRRVAIRADAVRKNTTAAVASKRNVSSTTTTNATPPPPTPSPPPPKPFPPNPPPNILDDRESLNALVGDNQALGIPHTQVAGAIKQVIKSELVQVAPSSVDGTMCAILDFARLFEGIGAITYARGRINTTTPVGFLAHSVYLKYHMDSFYNVQLPQIRIDGRAALEVVVNWPKKWQLPGKPVTNTISYLAGCDASSTWSIAHNTTDNAQPGFSKLTLRRMVDRCNDNLTKQQKEIATRLGSLCTIVGNLSISFLIIYTFSYLLLAAGSSEVASQVGNTLTGTSRFMYSALWHTISDGCSQEQAEAEITHKVDPENGGVINVGFQKLLQVIEVIKGTLKPDRYSVYAFKPDVTVKAPYHLIRDYRNISTTVERFHQVVELLHNPHFSQMVLSHLSNSSKESRPKNDWPLLSFWSPFNEVMAIQQNVEDRLRQAQATTLTFDASGLFVKYPDLHERVKFLPDDILGLTAINLYEQIRAFQMARGKEIESALRQGSQSPSNQKKAVDDASWKHVDALRKEFDRYTDLNTLCELWGLRVFLESDPTNQKFLSLFLSDQIAQIQRLASQGKKGTVGDGLNRVDVQSSIISIMTSLVGTEPSKGEQQEIAQLIDRGTITSHLHLMNKLIMAYAFNFETYNMMPRSTSSESAVDVPWPPFSVLG